MALKKNKNKKLIITIAVVLVVALLLGILYFNKFQEKNLPASNNKTLIPQTSETGKNDSIVATDKIVADGKTITADKIATAIKILTDSKTVTDGKIATAVKILTDDKTITDDKIAAAIKILTEDKTVTDDKIATAVKILTDARTITDDVIVKGDIIVMPAIDYKHLKKDGKLKQLMVSRKEKFGLKKTLDLIVNSDESFKIGDTQISMRDILEEAFIKEGEVFEEKIEDSGAVQPQKIKEYGIYVVQPGDNIWNIHFNPLKEFYEYQGINISPDADEPGEQGMSSGVGKILKFSETMVIIYNIIEKKVDLKIDLLEPLSKVVIYNMDEVFLLLQEINYTNIDRIQFDGKTIWIPTQKS